MKLLQLFCKTVLLGDLVTRCLFLLHSLDEIFSLMISSHSPSLDDALTF